ncbi:MAG: LysR family transcriptional regulator, partial [Thiotrichaceae bacterium]|nr:LysR family transcriptional regulator [Thiotrichaceae bacterium]
LMKVFGQEGAGIFIAPSAIEAEVELQYHAICIGRIKEVKERFYAISVERKVLHPVVAEIMETARESLFSGN